MKEIMAHIAIEKEYIRRTTGECGLCHKKPRVLVACPCRSCDRIETDGKPRWRICRKCAKSQLKEVRG